MNRRNDLQKQSQKYSKNKENIKYSNIFQYFDEEFYDFLTLVEKSKIPKQIRFKNKSKGYITNSDASKIKFFINNSGIKYKKNLIRKILLQNPIQIQNIINRSTYAY